MKIVERIYKDLDDGMKRYGSCLRDCYRNIWWDKVTLRNRIISFYCIHENWQFGQAVDYEVKDLFFGNLYYVNDENLLNIEGQLRDLNSC